jgi:hypothetical protein
MVAAPVPQVVQPDRRQARFCDQLAERHAHALRVKGRPIIAGEYEAAVHPGRSALEAVLALPAPVILQYLHGAGVKCDYPFTGVALGTGHFHLPSNLHPLLPHDKAARLKICVAPRQPHRLTAT